MAPPKRNDNLAPPIITRDEPMRMRKRIRELPATHTNIRSVRGASERGRARDLRTAREYCPAGADTNTDTQPKRTLQSAPVRHTYAPRRLFSRARARKRCPLAGGGGAVTDETAVGRRRSRGGSEAGALRWRRPVVWRWRGAWVGRNKECCNDRRRLYIHAMCCTKRMEGKCCMAGVYVSWTNKARRLLQYI